MDHETKRRPFRTMALTISVTLLAVAVVAPAAVSAKARTKLVTKSSAGVQGNGSAESTSVSANGRYVAFESGSDNLVPFDNNSKSDVFVHDRKTKKTKRISIPTGGGEANNNSYAPSISADGRFVAFESAATNIDGPDGNNRIDIFVRDRKKKKTWRVSETSAGTEANGGNSTSPSISANGRYIAFQSSAVDLVGGDTNTESDVFVHDRKTKRTKRVSVRSNGNQADDGASSPSISADGRFVVFESTSDNLVNGDNNSHRDIFVRNLRKKKTKRVSVRTNGNEASDDSRSASISADGRFVAFDSEAWDLVNGDTNDEIDVFVRDRLKRMTRRVSVRSNRAQSRNGPSVSPSISGSGRYVAFRSTATNLVKGDSNGDSDVFVHDRVARKTRRMSVRTNGGQALGGGSYTPSISRDGRFVGFYSGANDLVPGDSNGDDDIFLRGPLR